MQDNEKLLKEIKDELLHAKVSGAGYNPGPSVIWGAIMGGIRPCSWPGGFYGSPLPPGSGLCSRR
ncbi:hypothetical protein [Mixta intestinalis]|uniref:hypothetical protein n=1 Tax=Mixta intestinalis TaxID=1615494 RepID=UPI00136C90A1|nr:hypothetical protein [Mixta intestinalis]